MRNSTEAAQKHYFENAANQVLQSSEELAPFLPAIAIF